MDFYKLTYDEQVQHLRTFARDALDSWGLLRNVLDSMLTFSIEDPIQLVKYDNNAVFRVTTNAYNLEAEKYQLYTLRINRPNGKSLDWIASEVICLNSIGDNTALHVPQPLAPVYSGTLNGIEGLVHCVLFEWIAGDFIEPKDLTLQQVYELGKFLATLHNHTHIIKPFPGLLERPKLDYEGLFGERSPYNPKAGQQYISPESQHTLDAVAGRVREVMSAMDADENAFGLIHGDFIYKNTLFTPEGDVAAIDFDDCGFGYYLYDMACPLLFYKPLPAYTAMKNSLWEGYNSVRPLPEHYQEYLEVLVAGRYVASCRWVAGNAEHPAIKGRATDIINGRAEELRGFLNTGCL